MTSNCILKKPVYTDYKRVGCSLFAIKGPFLHLQNGSKCKSSLKKKNVLAMTLTRGY